MSRKVESMKRLYRAGRLTLARIETLLNDNEITQAEFEYIIK